MLPGPAHGRWRREKKLGNLFKGGGGGKKAQGKHLILTRKIMGVLQGGGKSFAIRREGERKRTNRNGPAGLHYLARFN